MPSSTASIQVTPGVAIPEHAMSFAFSSSGGPGGQNVNKRATKAELRVQLAAIPISERARQRLADLAGRRMGSDGEVIITADEHRSQGRNKDACIDRLRELLLRAIPDPKPRKPTKPSRGSKMRRLEAKKRDSDIKRSRRSVD
ncbi:MAG TPA: alternative ribosome rescue aminoacyl-tRNA hydrolase ArfB [Phycisphaerales bacterium]|nr:alternative ribosome rescue aminoacyl-tRNA hydrolase ArfB [Phycisphaerales bacterium]